jgi:GNAT superfamily N-acetyltransferase
MTVTSTSNTPLCELARENRPARRARQRCSLIVRPVCAADRRLITEATSYTSPETYYRRFHGVKSSFNAGELTYLCDVDGREHVALIATDASQHNRLAAVGRYVQLGDGDAELAITVHDPYQRQGLGRRMMTELVEHARSNGVRRLIAKIQPDNAAMRRLLFAVCPNAQVVSRDFSCVDYAVDLADGPAGTRVDTVR